MNTERFQFKVKNDNTKPAIWFQLRNKNVVVNPLMLYNLLWNYSMEDYFCQGISAHFLILKDEVYGSFQDNSCGHYDIEFHRDTFLESAQKSLNDLCNSVILGEDSAYERFGKETAVKMQIGLHDLLIPSNYHQMNIEEINVEEFSFIFTEPFNCDTSYNINIGNKLLKTCLSDWSNNFNMIRLEIEKSLETNFNGAEISLYFEDSPTIIHLRKQPIYDSNYYRISENKILKVSITPNDFVTEPNIYGWCEARQLIRSLYLGLLSLCLRETEWFKDGYNGSWNDFRLATYNKLQSCVIENYIKGVDEDDYIFLPRQRVINSVEAMIEDYNNLKDLL